MPRGPRGKPQVAEDSQAKNCKKRAVSAVEQQEHGASHRRKTDVAKQTSVAEDSNQKRRRTGETGGKPKKKQTHESTEQIDHKDHEALAGSTEASEQPPPFIVVPLPSGAAELLKETRQQEHGASHRRKTDVTKQTSVAEDSNQKRRRTGETGGKPKKKQTHESTEQIDHKDHEALAGSTEASEQPPPFIVVPLPSGAAELLKETRWLEHLKAVADVDAQVFSVKDTEICQADVPEVLEVYSPNGQSTCVGSYHLLPDTINEQRIWKKDGQERWIYSGVDGTWLVGGPLQQKQSFVCSSGLLHQALLHKGEMPHKLPGGSWRRVDGKTWKEDPDVTVKVPIPLLPGQPVKVTGLGIKNGLGRLISRRQIDGVDFWQVQLADRKEELPEKNLELKKIQQDEVWLTIGETLTRRAVQMCEVLAATLVGDVVKFSHLSEEAVGECPFLLPGHVQERLGVAELCDFMVKFSVILGFEEKETGQSGQSSQKSLLIFGKDPTPAVLALLKRIGELAPECLGSLESSDEALTSPAQFGVSVCFTPIPAEKDWLQRLAKAMQVQVSNVRGVSILLGGREEREKSLQLIQAADSGSFKVLPDVLEPCCASTRVPEVTVKAMEKELETLKEELGVISVWCVQAESTAEVRLDMREDLLPGMAVRAVYEDGDWYDATILEVHPVSEMVDVEWSDATSSRILTKDVRMKQATECERRRKRETLLQTARRLAIFGPLRERRIAACRVMVLVEEHCRGLWTDDLLQTMEELRGSSEDTSIDVKLCPLLGGPYPALHMLKITKGVKESLQRAASASGSYMCLLGRAALLVIGHQQERSRGMEYLEWILADKLAWETFSASKRSLPEEVQWLDGEDQLMLAMDDKGSLDFSSNGISEVREIDLMSYSGSMLHLQRSRGGKALRATDEEVVKRVFQLFLRSRLRKVLCTSRGDTAMIETTFGQAVWLEPVELRTIERKTKTLVIVPQIDKSASCWKPEASCKILVCGSETCREEAAKELTKCLESLASHAEAEEEEVVVEEEPEVVVVPKRKVPPPQAAAPVELSPSKGPSGPSNPLEELRKLRCWPKDNESWADLQETIWHGHPPLLPGWIRVWSRTKDREYFVNLSSGVTTFDVKTVAR